MLYQLSYSRAGREGSATHIILSYLFLPVLRGGCCLLACLLAGVLNCLLAGLNSGAMCCERGGGERKYLEPGPLCGMGAVRCVRRGGERKYLAPGPPYGLSALRCERGARRCRRRHPWADSIARGETTAGHKGRHIQNDTCGIRTHAGRPHRLSRPTP